MKFFFFFFSFILKGFLKMLKKWRKKNSKGRNEKEKIFKKTKRENFFQTFLDLKITINESSENLVGLFIHYKYDNSIHFLIHNFIQFIQLFNSDSLFIDYSLSKYYSFQFIITHSYSLTHFIIQTKKKTVTVLVLQNY